MRKSMHSAEYRLMRKKLIAMRNDAGLSQRQLGQLLSVPASWVSKVETGERRIDMVEFVWFCAACGANPVDAVSEIWRAG